MAKILFKITYTIAPEKREQYLSVASKLKKHLAGDLGKNYSIYENKSKPNKFSEIFICANQEEYDQLDDHDDLTSELVDSIASMLENGKMQYTTLVESE